MTRLGLKVRLIPYCHGVRDRWESEDWNAAAAYTLKSLRLTKFFDEEVEEYNDSLEYVSQFLLALAAHTTDCSLDVRSGFPTSHGHCLAQRIYCGGGATVVYDLYESGGILYRMDPPGVVD